MLKTAIIPPHYKFRHNYPLIHAIPDIIISCYENINDKKFLVLLFLDIRKAFDSISHNTLVKS